MKKTLSKTLRVDKKIKLDKKISSTDRLEAILLETEEELSLLQPQIEKLEKQIEKLKELKLAKQKLITLKLSIKSILSNFSSSNSDETITRVVDYEFRNLLSPELKNKNLSTSQVFASGETIVTPTPLPELPGVFVPEAAFQAVESLLRRKNSINYELFRAIVYSGGRASTEAIKQYLLENNIRQPGNGESFEQVELTDISSRVNYLVRKGVVQPEGRGHFVSRLGWVEATSAETPA